MTQPVQRDIYFSFFMFTANLQPANGEYTRQIVNHILALREFGYAGFDLPIAPPAAALDPAGELKSYEGLRKALDKAGLQDVGFTTNVGATRTYDPSSMYHEQRKLGLAYLKSRVDITRALRASIMAGPIVIPYGVFPTTDFSQPIWSDALQDWLEPRFRNARPVIEELGDYAAERGVTLAIEPVDHWETPGPNMVQDVTRFLEGLASPRVGACVDSAHVVLGSDGPEEFNRGIKGLIKANRLNYVHISAPDRGAVKDSWIPWRQFLTPIVRSYAGPLLVEVFNAIPVFLNSLRLSRRKFQIPGEDHVDAGRPDAYTVAHEAIQTVCQEIDAAIATAAH